jgi:hypothetical protein
MARPARVETARRTLAELTGELEDASLIAAEGQTALDLTVARQSCDQLIEVLEACLARLHRLRRHLG